MVVGPSHCFIYIDNRHNQAHCSYICGNRLTTPVSNRKVNSQNMIDVIDAVANFYDMVLI